MSKQSSLISEIEIMLVGLSINPTADAIAYTLKKARELKTLLEMEE